MEKLTKESFDKAISDELEKLIKNKESGGFKGRLKQLMESSKGNQLAMPE